MCAYGKQRILWVTVDWRPAQTMQEWADKMNPLDLVPGSPALITLGLISRISTIELPLLGGEEEVVLFVPNGTVIAFL